jgi:uncharacterized OsmC-like protein
MDVRCHPPAPSPSTDDGSIHRGGSRPQGPSHVGGGQRYNDRMRTDVVSAFDITLTQKDGFLFETTFDNPNHDPVFLDEPAPLGKDEAPNAARMLATAIGNCLSASLVFCLQKNGANLTTGVTAKVHLEITRNEHKRLRIGRVTVVLQTPPGVDAAAMQKCLPLFEDFCTVTASIRRGIDVAVSVQQG